MLFIKKDTLLYCTLGIMKDSKNGITPNELNNFLNIIKEKTNDIVCTDLYELPTDEDKSFMKDFNYYLGHYYLSYEMNQNPSYKLKKVKDGINTFQANISESSNNKKETKDILIHSLRSFHQIKNKELYQNKNYKKVLGI